MATNRLRRNTIHIAVAFLTLELSLSLFTPAQAHDTGELDEFMNQWTQQADISLTPQLLEAYDDMADRHPAYFGRPIYVSSSPSPPSRAMGSDVEQWRALVAGHFAPEDVDRALCLMTYESGGNPDAKNPNSSASGLMQIMGSWASVYEVTREQLFDPSINLYIAADLKARYGWTQWSPYNRGLCH